MRRFKIILSVVFVLGIGFFVARGCVQPKPPAETGYGLGPLPAKKKIKTAPPLVAGPPSPAAPAAPSKPKARLAIILDDWGNSYSVLKYATAVGRPLTLSILPHLPNSRRIAEEAHADNLGVMLHMPMQPKSKSERLEPHTILTTMSDEDIVTYTEEALESVPYAEGANNHMGSAATSDSRVMRAFLSVLKRQQLFFIDSNTSANTVGPAVAKELGLQFAKRDVFIDNELKKASIQKELELAKRIALRRGAVIVIGHDHKLTLETIAQMAPQFEKEGVKFVRVKDLLAAGEGN